MKLTVNGRAVFATTGGTDFDPARPAVVFLHGAGFDRTVWRLQTRWFAHHGRSVLAIDFPAHGWSEGPALDSIAAMADWTAALLDAAGLKQAALVGHSMGAPGGGRDRRALPRQGARARTVRRRGRDAGASGDAGIGQGRIRSRSRS